jgi:hypothetical protein
MYHASSSPRAGCMRTTLKPYLLLVERCNQAEMYAAVQRLCRSRLIGPCQ